MNKTLLLILCDFLLLNLLALTRWEKAEPPPVQNKAAAAANNETGGVSANQDLVAVMQLSLEDERAQRDQLASQLQQTSNALQDRESKVSDLSSSLQQKEQEALQLSQNLAEAHIQAGRTADRISQLQKNLEQSETQSARQKEALAQLETEQKQARERIENLSVAVKVAEQEKYLLKATAETLRDQVTAEREERLRVQETANQLAQGVGQLAEKSEVLSQEIRDSRPINANILYTEFVANRVETRVNAQRSGVFNPVNRQKSFRSVLVNDGIGTYALMHIEDTPFTVSEIPSDWAVVGSELRKGDRSVSVGPLRWLSMDPRLLVLQVSDEQVSSLGVKPYRIATDPFKFPEAVLISNGGSGYGEVPFKLDPATPGFVRMDNRLVRRLLGDFSPSRGDLVLSKTGELLGIMVNADYCALVTNFMSVGSIDPAAAPTTQSLTQIINRYNRLPRSLQ